MNGLDLKPLTPRPGRSSQSGALVKPEELPEQDELDGQLDSPPQTNSVPIGLPVSRQEYARLKEKAKETSPPEKPHAQQDPSARRQDA